jgi:hypothetical protein
LQRGACKDCIDSGQSSDAHTSTASPLLQELQQDRQDGVSSGEQWRIGGFDQVMQAVNEVFDCANMLRGARLGFGHWQTRRGS